MNRQGGTRVSGSLPFFAFVQPALRLVALWLLVWLWLGGCAPKPSHAPSSWERPSSSPRIAPRETPGFANSALLEEHFFKHGKDFRVQSAEQYLRLAQALRDAPLGGRVLEARRSDGVITRYDCSNGAFLAFRGDGVIKTFFKPRDGLEYFRRQLSREHRRK